MDYIEGNYIKVIHEYYSYMHSVEYLDLKYNSISKISDSFLSNMSKSTLNWLDLSQNRLRKIPKKLQILRNLDKIWISGNPIYCECSMTWMISWLTNFTTSSGEHVIVDYYDVKCHEGMMVGSPVYALDKVAMACYPKKLNESQKIAIGVGTGISVAIIIILLIQTIKRSRTLRFFIFYRLKIKSILHLTENDEENVDNKEYDAYLSYR